MEGDHAEALALLIAGVVRISKIGETGREITPYRFGLGQSCILTAHAILSKQAAPAIATVERAAEAVMIPADTFRDEVCRHDLWRGLVFDLLLQRLVSVMVRVEEVAFQRMDRRIAALLLDRVQSQNLIRLRQFLPASQHPHRIGSTLSQPVGGIIPVNRPVVKNDGNCPDRR